jgi:DNA-3-methyladenine glycosylase
MHDRARLGRAFFAAGAARVAERLLGCRLVRVLDDGTRLAGTIVEAEAYLGVRDRAAHSFGGRRTARNEAMYAEAGTAYVYFTYGMHHCFNVVCGRRGEPVAVLVRALEPTEGLEVMRRLRLGPGGGKRAKRGDTALCSGPAKLCAALAIDRSLNGIDLTRDGRLFLERGRGIPAERIVRTARIGVAYAGAWARRKLRWVDAASEHVSVRAGRRSAERRRP